MLLSRVSAGMRIDYVLVSKDTLAPRVLRTVVHGCGPERTGFLGSDQCTASDRSLDVCCMACRLPGAMTRLVTQRSTNRHSAPQLPPDRDARASSTALGQ